MDYSVRITRMIAKLEMEKYEPVAKENKDRNITRKKTLQMKENSYVRVAQ